jgi:ribonuclease HI
VDLWKRFIPLYSKHNIQFKWVKGHAGDPENERCDYLAVKSVEDRNMLDDHGYLAENP